MINYIIQNWHNGQFMLEMLLSCMIYVIPLEKRNRFALRLTAGVVICISCSLTMSLPKGETMTTEGLVISTALFVIEFILAALLIYLICNVTLYEAFFCGSCAYATQHFAYSLNGVFRECLDDPWITKYSFIVVYLIVLVSFYFAFARNLTDGKQYHMGGRQAIAAVCIVIAVVFILSTISQQIERRYGTGATLDSHLYAMLCCGFALWVQVSLQRQTKMKNEMLLNEQIWHKQKEQYEATHENIEIINRKCHDLKYQVAALRTMRHKEEYDAHLDEIEKAIDIYDTSMKTGNEVLDTILTEKTLYCDAHKIILTCVADGSQMKFMDPTDIYSIFGNAVDNAIEHVENLENEEKRLLAIMVWSRSNLLIIQVENYCEQPPAMKDGFPVTTKSDPQYHGFGLKSIQYTAEKYGGAMSIHVEDELFVLRVSIPIRSSVQR